MADIPAPILEIRNVELLTAQALARIVMPPSIALIDSYVATLLALKGIIEAGELPAEPLCKELTNVNPSAPHVVLIEAFCWLLEQIAYRINQLPRLVEIEFARLFGIMIRGATEATTTLRFTVAAPPGTDVTIPEGTEVTTADGAYTFRTDTELVIPSGEATGDVSATRTVAGSTLLAPNTLTKLEDSIAWVSSVTNFDAVDSGSEEETVDSALNRARSFQRRGLRLVSKEDYEDAILQDILQGNGIVRAFPLRKLGEWSEEHAGYATIVVMTRNGHPVSDEVKRKINSLLPQGIGGPIIHLTAPIFADFSSEFDVRLESMASESATRAAILKNLQNYYAVSEENFGRWILRSDIIREVESTDGVRNLVPRDGNILVSPLVDTPVAPYAQPRLIAATINFVP